MDSGIGFTPAIIQQLRKELNRHREAAATHTAKAAAVEKILAGALELEPDLGMEAAAADAVDEFLEDEAAGKSTTTLPDAIRETLRKRGMTKLGLREHLSENYPHLKLGASGQYFYKTVRRLKNNGEIRERRKRLSLAD